MNAPKVTLLDGLRAGPFSEAVRAALPDGSPSHRLGDEVYAPCKGCFECWVKEPGRCGMRDAANGTMQDAIAADVLLITTRVRFGSYHPLTKAALDRMIGLLSPFFQVVGGETHHRRRYGRYPHWAFVVEVDREIPEAERALFVETARRSALDLHSPAPWIAFLPADLEPSAITAQVREGLASVDEEPAPPVWTPRWPDPVGVSATTPVHAVLWVGSAKPPGSSNSENLGAFLLGALEERGWTTEIVHARPTTKLKRGEAPRLEEAVRRADLLILATPVYVDTLPSLVLEGLSDLRERDLGSTALLPIVQCGFPELLHTETTVASCAVAAEQLGFAWAGHLALGGGGMVAESPLYGRGGLQRQQDALVAVADALDEGRGVTDAARKRFAETLVPGWSYRSFGNVGWLSRAWKHGALTRLWDRPFEGS